MSAEAILANFGGVMWTLDTFLRASNFIFQFGYIPRWVFMPYIQDILKKLRAFCIQSCEFCLFSSPSAALEAFQLCPQFGSCLLEKFTARLLIHENLLNFPCPLKITCSFTWDKRKLSKIPRSTLNFVFFYMGQRWDTRKSSVDIIETPQEKNYFASLSWPIVMKFVMGELWYIYLLIIKERTLASYFLGRFLKWQIDRPFCAMKQKKLAPLYYRLQR